mmetsp:Transcript_13982/g.28433  ORF Transcript_13982/g.28433 Transcript_13982/m.28433 type:complete len:152 (+) Transcript_13982:268-723(+)
MQLHLELKTPNVSSALISISLHPLNRPYNHFITSHHIPFQTFHPIPSPGVCLQAVFRKLQPLADRVLVKRAPKETQLASGLYLPTDSTKDPNEGEVFAVGPGQVDVTGNLHATTLAPGDKVLLPEYGGTKIKLGEDEVFMFRESDILGKFD